MLSDDKNDKASSIVRVGIRLFSEHGFERVKVSDITEELGMGKGTFYLYFKNKRELLLECFKQLEVMISRFERSKLIREEADFCIRMKNRYLTFQENYLDIVGILHLLRNECNASDAKIREKAIKAYDAFVIPLQEDIEDSIKKKTIQPINSELAAYTIVGTAESLAFRAHLDAQTSPQTVDMFYHTIRSMFFTSSGETVKRMVESPCVVTDQQAVSTALSQLRLDGNPYVTGFVGDAEVLVDLAKIDSLSMVDAEPWVVADVVLKDGNRASLNVAGTTTVTGESPLGIFRIPLRKVREIAFGAQPAK